MRQPKSRPPIGIKQLCGITRAVLEERPTIDNFEWHEEIKARLIRQGYTYPDDPSAIHRAMSQVERALVRKWGPRPSVAPRKRAPPEATETEDQRPFTPAETHAILVMVSARCGIPLPGFALSRQNSRGGGFQSLRQIGNQRPSSPNRQTTQQQIDAERSSHPKARYLKTPTGWVTVTKASDAPAEVGSADPELVSA